MKTRTIKLPEPLDAKLTRYAAANGSSASAVLREALATYLTEPKATKRSTKPVSFADLARDLAGSVNAPPDLSTNPKYLQGLGRPRR